MLTLIGNHLRERQDSCSIWHRVWSDETSSIDAFRIISSTHLLICHFVWCPHWVRSADHLSHPIKLFFFTFFMVFRLSAKFFDSMWLAGEEGGRVGIGDCQWVYKCHSIKVESTTRCAHHHVPALLSVRRTWMCLDTRREPSALCKSFMCVWLHVCVLAMFSSSLPAWLAVRTA